MVGHCIYAKQPVCSLGMTEIPWETAKTEFLKRTQAQKDAGEIFTVTINESKKQITITNSDNISTMLYFSQEYMT